MRHVPEPVRELRPHFIFKILEKITDRLWEIGGGAVMAAVLWFVSKLRSNLDYVSIGVVFCVGVLLMYLSVKRSAPRPILPKDDSIDAHLEQPTRQINDAHNGLQVTSAIWRCVEDPTIFNVVTGNANSLIREAKTLTAKAENRIFGDPCNKHKPFVKGHHKNLELTYVFQGNKLLSEYDPPHTLTVTENWDASDTPQAALAAPQPQSGQTPYLTVEFTELHGGTQMLGITNTGETPAHYIEFGSLLWQERRRITLRNQIPPLMVGKAHEVQMYFDTDTGHGGSLLDFMRRHTPSDAETYVMASFQNQTGEQFHQKMTLTTFANGKVIWQPGPVQKVSLREHSRRLCFQ